MRQKTTLFIIILLLSILFIPQSGVADKGKVATSCVFIQTDVMEDYRYDQDVILKVRARVYINGIPQRENIVLQIKDQYGRNLLDTISPNPITLTAGQVTEINMGRCDVGLYMAKLIGTGAGQNGDLLVQWVVSYPPTDYYFSWFDTSGFMSSISTVKAEFESLEEYQITEPVWDENQTKIIDNKTMMVKKPFTLHFYYLNKNGGQTTLKYLSDVTKGSWDFDDIYQGGVYCEIVDIHEWKDTEWWLGSQKNQAAPMFPLEKLIIGFIISIVLIIVLKYVFNIQIIKEGFFGKRKRKRADS